MNRVASLSARVVQDVPEVFAFRPEVLGGVVSARFARRRAADAGDDYLLALAEALRSTMNPRTIIGSAPTARSDASHSVVARRRTWLHLVTLVEMARDDGRSSDAP